MQKIWQLLRVCLCVAIACLSEAQNITLQHYTVQDGLVANPIRAIFQDSKGFIWIGTWEGLSRYDGYKFTNFTTANGLSHNLVNDFFEADGRIYVAENNGAIDVIEHLVPKKVVQLQTAANKFNPLPGNTVVVSSDNSGLFQLDRGKFVIPAQQNIYPELIQLIPFNDSLYLGFTNDRLLFIDHSNYALHSSTKIPSHSILRLYRDTKKRVWACTVKGLKQVSPAMEPGQPPLLLPPPATFEHPRLSGAAIMDILDDENGGFWMGTFDGLLHVTESTGHLERYTEMDGLPSPVVNILYSDREKNLWIGTELGLAKLVTQRNLQYLKNSIGERRNDILDVVPLSRNRFLVTDFFGIQRYDSAAEIPTYLHRFPAPEHAAFIKNRWPLLFYYNNWLVSLDEQATGVKWKKEINGLSTTDFSSCTDGRGNSFIANQKGLVVVLNNGRCYIDSTLPYRITSLIADGTTLWAGTWNEGLFRLHYYLAGDTIFFSPMPMTHLVKQKQIRSLYRDIGGNIWVGTRYDGAFRISRAKGKGLRVHQYEKSKGLSSNFITSFAETGGGDIWVGSYLGLDKLVKEKDSFRVFRFSQVTNFFAHIRNIIPAENGSWYCIANYTLTKITDAVLERTGPNQTQILSAMFGSAKESINWDYSNNVTMLRHSQNAATIAFSAPSFINEKQLLYSYRLQGSGDTSWSTPQNVHEVSFASLSPARYRFEVRTVGWNGKVGKPAFLLFVIYPPFWQTAWFYALCAALLAAILYTLHRYRINAVLKWQKARDRIATDLHDDLGSTLTNISILSELSHKNLHQPEQASHFLRRITEEVYNSSQAMDDIVWSINSRNDSLEETLARMRRYAAELFEGNATRCNLQIDVEQDESIRLEMELRRDVYLIFKESVNNIHRHASAKNVWIQVRYKAGRLYLSIRDDGKGFTTNVGGNRNGLTNLQARAKKWSGTIEISSSPGNGTNIQVNIPLTNR